MSAFRERPSRCAASHGSCHVPATDASYLTPPRGASVPHAVSTGTTCLHADSQGVRLVHESFARTWNRVATHDVMKGSTTNLRRMTDCYGMKAADAALHSPARHRTPSAHRAVSEQKMTHHEMNREILQLENLFGHIFAVVLAQSPRFPPCGSAASNASRAASDARCIVTRHGAIKLGRARENPIGMVRSRSLSALARLQRSSFVSHAVLSCWYRLTRFVIRVPPRDTERQCPWPAISGPVGTEYVPDRQTRSMPDRTCNDALYPSCKLR